MALVNVWHKNDYFNLNDYETHKKIDQTFVQKIFFDMTQNEQIQ